MAQLKLANIFNKMSPATSPTAEQDQQRSRNLGSALQLAAKVAGGEGIDPQASGFQQAITAGLLGGAQGFTNKADMQKAQAQDEYNTWVQEVQKAEAQAAQAADFQAKEKAAIMQASIPALSAYQQYTQGGDKEAYVNKLKSIGTAFAAELGGELINLHLDPGSDQMVVMTISDVTGDGQQDTKTINLAQLIGPATELNAEFAKGMLPVFGVTPPAKEGTTELTFEQFQAMSPEERALYQEFSGKGGKGPKKDTGASLLGKKGNEEIQKKRAALLNGSPERAAARGRIAQVQELLASGTQTGALTELSSQALGILGTALGVDFSSVSNVAQLNALLKGQLSGVLSIFGAGTGISNRDVENAQLIIGSVENPADALRKIQAYAAANLRVAEEQANVIREVDLKMRAGDIDEVEGERLAAQAESGQFERIQALYKEELDKALGMEQNFLRTGSTAGAAAAPQEIEIDLDGNIIQ